MSAIAPSLSYLLFLYLQYNMKVLKCVPNASIASSVERINGSLKTRRKKYNNFSEMSCNLVNLLNYRPLYHVLLLLLPTDCYFLVSLFLPQHWNILLESDSIRRKQSRLRPLQEEFPDGWIYQWYMVKTLCTVIHWIIP